MSTGVSIEGRFWLHGKVEFTPECWNWLAAKSQDGYGKFSINGRMRRAHRVAYEMSVGPIPEGMVIDHICHNILCVKPDHLRVVTTKQNLENLTGAYANSTSGVRGVRWHKHGKKWNACVKHKGTYIWVGAFRNLEDAEAAVIAKRNELFTHNDADRMGDAA